MCCSRNNHVLDRKTKSSAAQTDREWINRFSPAERTTHPGARSRAQTATGRLPPPTQTLVGHATLSARDRSRIHPAGNRRTQSIGRSNVIILSFLCADVVLSPLILYNINHIIILYQRVLMCTIRTIQRRPRVWVEISAKADTDC